MASPSTLPELHYQKRQRLPSVDEDDDDYNASSDEVEEEDEDSDDSDTASLEDEDIMATIGNDAEDILTEVQSGRSVSSSPISSSQQSVKLKSSDVLDCPTCCEPLKRPIYQCNNGHVACSSCCTKLKMRCPFCRSHIGDIRCRAMEKVIEASVVPCRNAVYGCKQTTAYGDRPNHEKLCVFTKCFCPLRKCNYTGSYTDLKSHARALHKHLTPLVMDRPLIFGMNLDKKNMVVFQEMKEGDLIVVQAFKRLHGVYVTVNRIAPLAPEIHNLSCSLAKLKAHTTLKLGLQVKKIQKVNEEDNNPQDGFMLIPNYMLSDGNLKMQICIGSEYRYIHI